jgi:hypothetical protein
MIRAALAILAIRRYPASMSKATVSDTIREAIRNHPEDRAAIARKTGISQAVLCRFLQGTRGMTMGRLDLLCDYLKLHLVSKNTKGK